MSITLRGKKHFYSQFDPEEFEAADLCTQHKECRRLSRRPVQHLPGGMRGGRDSENRCGICGQTVRIIRHDPTNFVIFQNFARFLPIVCLEENRTRRARRTMRPFLDPEVGNLKSLMKAGPARIRTWDQGIMSPLL
jgi:hypothetical protein